MLRELTISGLAVVKELCLEFGPGLNVLTGETGAGKSIIVGAIGLLVGEKAGGEMVRTGEKAARVTGAFEIAESQALVRELESSGISCQDKEVVVKREISADGRTRAYVNGEPVSLAVLRKLGDLLVDFHGQHEHQSLLNKNTHVDFLDAFGGLVELREQVWRACSELREARRKLEAFLEMRRDIEAQTDYIKFQISEIEAARLREGEEEKLEMERALLVNSEKLATNIGEASLLLYEQELSCAERLARATKALRTAAEIDPRLSDLCGELGNAEIAVAEAGRALAAYLGSLEFSASRLDEVESRLDLIGRLKKKYGSSVKGLTGLLEELRGKLSCIEPGSGKEDALKDEIGAKSAELAAKATLLLEKRRTAGARLERAVQKELAGLGMKGTRFVVQVELELGDPWDVEIQGKTVRIGPQGPGEVQFLISPNVGEDLKPLVRIASGGEVSRIMLAIKTVLVHADCVELMVFDEVDAGIGGRVARAVGEKLKGLCREKQIVCITHIPLIASLGDTHFFVSKEVERGRTYGTARALRGMERVDELARMLAGDKVSDVTLKQAREMLEYGSGQVPARAR